MAFDLDISQYEYPELEPGDQDWRWFHKYPHDIITGKVPSGKLMRQAAERHFRDMERDDIYVDEEAAKSIVLWFKFVPITDGKNAGKPTILLPWQIWVVVSVIAWKWASNTYDEDDNPLTVAGERRYNQTFLLVSRKGGKTTLAAGIMLYLMYKSGYQPRAFSLATKKDQAKLLWKAAKVMIKLSPRLKQIFEPRANDILMPDKDGEFKALASESSSLDGLNPITASLDECHAVKDRNLYGVIVSAFGAQTEYLMLTITTAGFILDGLCTDLYNNGKRVLDPEDEITQDNYFYAIWQLDPKDDWTEPRNWYKSNPGLIYGLPSMRYLRDRLKEATMAIEEKANFLTKHCNLFVSSADVWLDYDKFVECGSVLNFDDYKDRHCYIGFDRSQVSDITSAAVLFPDSDGGCTVFIFNIQSQGAIKNAGDYLQTIYRKAEAAGHLTVVRGNVIRNADVEDLVLQLWRELPKCEAVFYDPYKMTEVAMNLEDKSVNIVAVSQGPGNLSEPTKKVEQMYQNDEFRYNTCTLLEYAASCALIDVTVFGNTKCYRDPGAQKVDKIDPLVATIIALSGATLQKIESNVYEQRGMLSV
tara:strand:- start:2592 stop:4355 length:1764 start_codon:yes stop_codon:yes gene_type:complete